MPDPGSYLTSGSRLTAVEFVSSASPGDSLALARSLAAAPTRVRGQHKCPAPGYSSGGLSFLLGSHPEPQVPGGEAHVSAGGGACVVQTPAWSQAGQEDVGAAGSSWTSPPLNPESAASADPHLENSRQRDKFTLPGPLPPSLCWSCHDNQSSTSMPKTLRKQQQKLQPPPGEKGAREGTWANASPSPTAPEGNAELGGWAGGRGATHQRQGGGEL